MYHTSINIVGQFVESVEGVDTFVFEIESFDKLKDFTTKRPKYQIIVTTRFSNGHTIKYHSGFYILYFLV